MKIENIYHIRVTGNRLQKVGAQKGALAKKRVKVKKGLLLTKLLQQLRASALLPAPRDWLLVSARLLLPPPVNCQLHNVAEYIYKIFLFLFHFFYLYQILRELNYNLINIMAGIVIYKRISFVISTVMYSPYSTWTFVKAYSFHQYQYVRMKMGISLNKCSSILWPPLASVSWPTFPRL